MEVISTDGAQAGIAGSALRRARQHTGLSQRELARRAGLAATTVRQLEQRPRFGRALNQLAQALTVADFMNGGPLEQHLEARLLELEQRVDTMDELLFGSCSDQDES
jgi:transcriptional regulator with XRE-family HTH domain